MQNVVAVALVPPNLSLSTAEEHLEELAKLIETAGGKVVSRMFAKRPAPDSATYVGKGKAEQIQQVAEQNDAALVVFDDDLSPAQVRNLDKVMDGKARVI